MLPAAQDAGASLFLVHRHCWTKRSEVFADPIAERNRGLDLFRKQKDRQLGRPLLRGVVARAAGAASTLQSETEAAR